MSSGEDRLYGIVETYAALGWHRTGTDVDAATATWFADELGHRGLTVSIESVPFARWVATSRLLADGDDVDHLPLLTPWTGAVDTATVDLRGFEPHSGGFPTLVDEPLRLGIAEGAEASVLATLHPRGSLVGVNRDPTSSATPRVPAVLIAGDALDTCSARRLRLGMDAHVDTSASTTNVIGRRAGPGRPVLLTTPLTGWFGCAGERGTGIAVLLELIDRLADVPLLVVGTGGHELGFFGAHRHVDAMTAAPRAVIHLGASIGVEEVTDDGDRRLASTRVAMTTLDQHDGEPVAAALESARLGLTTSASSWIGEAQAWRRLEVPMLSMSGAGIDFHTPDDTPERATSPRGMTIAADAVTTAAERFLAAVGTDPTANRDTPRETP